MGARGPQPQNIELSNAQLQEVMCVLGRGKTEQRVAARCRILVLSHEGLGPTEIAARIDWHRASVTKVLARFRTSGLDAIYDRARSGRPRAFSPSGPGTGRLAGL